ncbi:hypothetical protein DICPUDRAFT_154557 [Dictyostelium purpureum]|uniref:Uncharacterized protein n=1 Tax=Dictyostelium purpureum TaxID=5786 RepID=F0ZRN0_DICPU|nr:uncharacterized protein DICPUDRAFT_154557 [Dictyostelium purpureum]EGC33398.1 hypothetical protein DICPUDRAFT_154557 [Dictyostelium purpureum]|eukprot:XP_003290062.1 hypothetical protein DICPUDRAFT_154557 [Dictyostelium purpureum]
MTEYPKFATKDTPFSISFNNGIKDNNKVIGIYNQHYAVCLKGNDGGIITLYDLNNNNQQFKQFSNVCKKHKDCDRVANIIDNDTVFIECLFSDYHYHYSMINLSNDQLYESKDYFYGKAKPTSNCMLTEWSRIKVPSIQDPNVNFEFIKVVCFNFVTGQEEFVHVFIPFLGETFTSISINKEKTKLIISSLFKGYTIISVRSIEQSESPYNIIQLWTLGKDDELLSLNLKDDKKVIIHSKLSILVYDMPTNRYWYILPEPGSITEVGSLVQVIDNILVHWYRHRINEQGYLFLNFWDIQQDVSIKSIKLDPKYASNNPPVSITSNNDKSKLLVINNNEIHTLDFN